MEQVTKYFEQCIQTWLEGEKKKDETFAKKVDESKKDVAGCCNYIISQVRASKQCGFADEEIYGMARHYFDEDDVKDPGAQGNCRVVVSGHIELTDSEKDEARQKAVEEYKAEIRKAEAAKLEQAKKAEEERKAKLREQREKQQETQPDLFGF